MKKLKLRKTLGLNYQAHLADIIPAKKALNKAGHYKVPGWGYTDSVDQKLLDGIVSFQSDNDLVPDGVMTPEGKTLEKLNQVAVLDDEKADTPTGTKLYRWITTGDSKVRSKHADRNGKVFDWATPPEGGHPGEDYNCRCKAEAVANRELCQQLLNERTRLKEEGLSLPTAIMNLNNYLVQLRKAIGHMERGLDALDTVIAALEFIAGTRIVKIILRMLRMQQGAGLSPPSFTRGPLVVLEKELKEKEKILKDMKARQKRLEADVARLDKLLDENQCKPHWSSQGPFV